MKSSYDVVVIGAGPAGVAAAAAAANIADVLLVESTDRLGGSVTAAMHRCMCGLYSHAPQNILDTLNNSAQRCIVQKMSLKEPDSVRPRQFGKAWVLEFPSSTWESSLSELISQSKVDLQLRSRVTAVRREGSRLTAIRLEHAPENWIETKALLDCTGGGHILRLIGNDAFLPPDQTTPANLAGFAFRLTGLQGDPEMLRLQTPYHLAQAVEKGLLPRLARFTVFYPGPEDGGGVCKLAIDPAQLAVGEAELLAHQILDHLKRECEPFANAKITETSARVLPREGLRLGGRYIVTEDDILQGRKYGQNAIHAWWPIERWTAEKGPTYIYPPPGEHFDIPTDALHSATIENLFAAGACLSATPTAAASTRASGICLATGDAAGKLAASFCKR